MPDINTGKFTRFRDGGVIKITDLETGIVHTLIGRERDSLQFAPGLNEAIVDMEEGALKTDARRGDQRSTTLRIAVKGTTTMRNTGGLYDLLQGQIKGTDDGLLRKFTVVAEFRDFAGQAAAQETFTFANCIVDATQADPLQYSEGSEYDLLQVSFRSLAVAPSIASV